MYAERTSYPSAAERLMEKETLFNALSSRAESRDFPKAMYMIFKEISRQARNDLQQMKYGKSIS